jgi:hypothetical protein
MKIGRNLRRKARMEHLMKLDIGALTKEDIRAIKQKGLWSRKHDIALEYFKKRKIEQILKTPVVVPS